MFREKDGPQMFLNRRWIPRRRKRRRGIVILVAVVVGRRFLVLSKVLPDSRYLCVFFVHQIVVANHVER